MSVQEQTVRGAVQPLVEELSPTQFRVQVRYTDLDELETGPAELLMLSMGERVRAARLKSPLERQRYVASCVFTRRVLGDLSGVAPERLEFHRDKCGKPWLSVPVDMEHAELRELLSFSVSHSENVLGLAVGRGCGVGFDVEVVKQGLDILAVADASLSRADYDRVRSSTEDERCSVFYRLWTLREAFAKMQGHGVASDHVCEMPAVTWSLRSFELVLGGKRVVGSLCLADHTQVERSSSGLFLIIQEATVMPIPRIIIPIPS